MDLINVNLNIFNGTYQLFNEINIYTFIIDFLYCLTKLFYRNNFFVIEILILSFAIYLNAIGRHLFTIKIVDKLVHNGIIHKEHRSRFVRFGLTFLITIIIVILAGIFNYQTGCLKNLKILWSDYNNVDQSMPIVFIIPFLMHSSFYIYSTYALIFHDERDKDLVIFLIHHLIVILISTISYAVGKTYLTSAVGFLLELNEILMAMKIIFKLQFQFIQKNGEKLRLVFLPVFTITFVHTRLFIYPYIVLECLQFLKQSLGKSEWDAIYLSIYFFYFMIYIMNFYWTLLVIRATVYAFRNGLANLEDVREIENNIPNQNRNKMTINNNGDYNNNNNNNNK